MKKHGNMPENLRCCSSRYRQYAVPENGITTIKNVFQNKADLLSVLRRKGTTSAKEILENPTELEILMPETGAELFDSYKGMLEEEAITAYEKKVTQYPLEKGRDLKSIIQKAAGKLERKLTKSELEKILRWQDEEVAEEIICGRLFGLVNKEILKLDDLRSLLPDKYQKIDKMGNKIGNVAYSTSDINGYSISEMKSFSKFGSKGKNGIKNRVDGWISNVDNPKYSDDVLPVNKKNEIDIFNGYLRNNDTEYKIIENYKATGRITIVSEREIYPSCDNIIKSFSKDYKNIEIILMDGNGNMYKIKDGFVY